MALAELKVKRWVNSLAVVIPKKSADELELKGGEQVSLDILAKKRIDAFGIFQGAKPFRREEFILDR